MGIVSPGFRGRPRAEGMQLPPGQYLTEDFPVLSAGPTPRIPLDRWEFVITTETGQEHRWSWPELLALPSETPTVDIHWAGVSPVSCTDSTRSSQQGRVIRAIST